MALRGRRLVLVGGGSTSGMKPNAVSVSEIQDVFEVAASASPNGIVVCDETGAIVYANRQIEFIFGYGSEELVGEPIERLLPEECRATHLGARDRFLANPESRPMGAGRELQGRRKDGTRVPVEIGLELTSREGRILAVASVVDITERKQLERKIRDQTAESLAFERLVADVAARFVSLSADAIDEAIVESQRQVVETLHLDRSTLWQFTSDGQDLLYTHMWARPEFPPPPARVSVKEMFPWLLSRVQANEAVWNTSMDDLPPMDRKNLERLGSKANAVIPLEHDGRVMGALSFGSMQGERDWTPDVRGRMRLLAAVFAQALARKKNQVELALALEEVERLRDRLASENVQLRHEVKALREHRTIVAESEAVRRALAQAESVAPTDATVLLLGETGCGKEVFAQAIHDMSKRRDRPMVRVNCAAIPTALMESELFGRERGAYTGALSRQIGRFELASGTTIFLDEVGDLPLEAQAKLLRVLQDRTLERLGSVRPIRVDVRIIAATNRDLTKAVADRTFREDLYYRLNVFPIQVPPLRERLEDIPILVWMFVDEYSKTFRKGIESISRESLAALQRHSWPGNVRELRNVIERAVIVARGPRLTIDPPGQPPADRSAGKALSEVEGDHIRAVLQSVGWRVRGKGGAAEILRVKPTTLDSRMAKLGIRRPNR